MAIRLLSFDLDDTLWPCMPTILRAEAILYDWMLANIPDIASQYNVESLRQHRKQYGETHPEVAHCMTALRLASFRDLCDIHDHHDRWIDEAFDIFYQARQQVELYSEAAPVLDALSRHYRLVALTNGNADISITGIDRWMEFCLNPAMAGVAKPHADMFKQLAQRAGVDLQDIIHIGDHPEHDILGAVQAGVTSIWVNRDGQVWQQEDYRADHEISSLSELPSALKQIIGQQ